MIPKIIHYYWVSDGDMPLLVQECIESWKKHFPDYEMHEWNNTNFEAMNVKFTAEAMKKKKYAFVSDYVRLYALYKYGGIYLDTDVKVLKSFNNLLNNRAFIGFENEKSIGVGVFASEAHNPLLKQMLDLYARKAFLDNRGNMDLTPIPKVLEPIFLMQGIKLNGLLQRKEYITVYPTDVFYPLNYNTGKVNITPNSYAIHLYNASWKDIEDKKYIEACRKYYIIFERFFPCWGASLLSKIYATIKIEGKKSLWNKIKRNL